MILITLCLLLSISLNAILGWYAHQSAKRISYINENLSFLYVLIDSFLEHTKTVYELETIYGDQEMKGLVQHAHALREQIGGLLETYDLSQENLQEELERIRISPDDDEGSSETPPEAQQSQS